MKVTCPRCGVAATVTPDGRGRWVMNPGPLWAACEEAAERMKAGEKSIPWGECKALNEAVKRVIAARG